MRKKKRLSRSLHQLLSIRKGNEDAPGSFECKYRRLLSEAGASSFHSEPTNPAEFTQGNRKDAVESCTQGLIQNSLPFNSIHASTALLDYPDYVKALERRAACNDILNTWSSLTSAQEGIYPNLSCSNCLLREKLITRLQQTALARLFPFQLADIRRKLQVLKPRLEVAQKGEMDEMLGS